MYIHICMCARICAYFIYTYVFVCVCLGYPGTAVDFESSSAVSSWHDPSTPYKVCVHSINPRMSIAI